MIWSCASFCSACERSTSLPSTLAASAARARPAPMEAATSATLTGPGNDFDEPSGRRILGIARENAYYHDEIAAFARDQPLRPRARPASAGHRAHRARAADRGDLLPLRALSRMARLRDVVRQGGVDAVAACAGPDRAPGVSVTRVPALGHLYPADKPERPRR